MAILSKKNTKTSKEKNPPSPKATEGQGNLPAVKSVPVLNLTASADVIKKPHLTEKTYALQADGVYVFEVNPRSTKSEIAKSIEVIYKVKPEQIRIINTKAKNVIWRGEKGKTSNIKKAYVYLKKGDKIDLA